MDIQIENLSKSYGHQKAVDDISFHVHTGEILGFLGPNGAGKTTVMKMITGFLGMDAGSIKIGDIDVREQSELSKKHIGYLPENNPLYSEMPLIEYLEFSAALQNVKKEDIPARVKEMVKVCGLNAEKHKNIGELSKGYQQRVGIAQAMIHDPEILILDEPTTGLDPNQIVEIRKLIRDLGKEKTVLLSTHILPEVEAICDRILIIHKGKIVADDTSDTLRQKGHGQETVKVKIEDAEDSDVVLQALNALSSVKDADYAARNKQVFNVQSKPEQSAARDIFSMCVKNNWVITELIPKETKLEDIFRNLTMK
ncbi:MAG: ATP-binding cassette domain-containing protein [Bacteroidales bacterium]